MITLLAGILLIIGSILSYKGKVYIAMWVYFATDLLWMIEAYIQHTWVSLIVILISEVTSGAILIKMYKGEFVKDLKVVKNKKKQGDD
ncbi:MAG: hypothetical protein QXP36_10185 [Conexivisphaerales archaeon]